MSFWPAMPGAAVNRLPLFEALTQGRLVAKGEATQADAFAQWFRGA
jgi:hypothetical protein